MNALRTTGRWPTEILRGLRHWFDSDGGRHVAAAAHVSRAAASRTVDWPRVVPFIALHFACVAVIWVGWSVTAVSVAIALYVVRMFAITGFYHRYFSHRAFDTLRAVQFLFAVVGATVVQRGRIWWASQHRHHHAHADRPMDPHSPRQHGFWWSHTGWFLSRENFPTRERLVADLLHYPELRMLDRFDVAVPLLLAATLYAIGVLLEHRVPVLGTNGPQLVVWGFVISTVVLYHATFSVNSLAHRFGWRRYETRDDSRNNVLLALVTPR